MVYQHTYQRFLGDIFDKTTKNNEKQRLSAKNLKEFLVPQ